MVVSIPTGFLHRPEFVHFCNKDVQIIGYMAPTRSKYLPELCYEKCLNCAFFMWYWPTDEHNTDGDFYGTQLHLRTSEARVSGVFF